MLTTVTSFNEVAVGLSEIFNGEEEIATSARSYPINDTTSAFADGGAETLNEPLLSVVVPIWVPLTWIETPGIGDPSFESVTLPVTVTFWAIAGITKKHIRIKQLTLSKFLICIKFGLNG